MSAPGDDVVPAPGAPPHPTRVLVVDDSVVVRRMLTRVLSGATGVEVVGTAGNGCQALDKLPLLHPDVVVLDIDMPVMDGLATLDRIRAVDAHLPVIVFSNLTGRGAPTTTTALARGASDVAAKPVARDAASAEDQVRRDLVPMIRRLGQWSPERSDGSTSGRSTRPRTPSRTPRCGFSVVTVVAVAVSTGGPAALAQLLPCLPPGFPVPVLVVQHMPAVFTGPLADRLDRVGPLPACQASDGQPVEAGHVYLAPGSRHMVVADAPSGSEGRRSGSVLCVHDGPPENSCRPSADVLLRSVAARYGAGTLAVVMTGMGSDGLRGAEAVRAAGGVVIAQDPSTCVVPSMPGAVIGAGLADAVVALDALAEVIVAWTARGRAR